MAEILSIKPNVRRAVSIVVFSDIPKQALELPHNQLFKATFQRLIDHRSHMFIQQENGQGIGSSLI